MICSRLKLPSPSVFSYQAIVCLWIEATMSISPSPSRSAAWTDVAPHDSAATARSGPKVPFHRCSRTRRFCCRSRLRTWRRGRPCHRHSPGPQHRPRCCRHTSPARFHARQKGLHLSTVSLQAARMREAVPRVDVAMRGPCLRWSGVDESSIDSLYLRKPSGSSQADQPGQSQDDPGWLGHAACAGRGPCP